MSQTQDTIASIELSLALRAGDIDWALDHRDRAVFAEQCQRREDLKAKLAHLQAVQVSA